MAGRKFLKVRFLTRLIFIFKFTTFTMYKTFDKAKAIAIKSLHCFLFM